MKSSSLDIVCAADKVFLHSALQCRNLPGHKSREDGNQTKIQRGAGCLQCHEEVFQSLWKGFGTTVVRRVCGRHRGIKCRSALKLSMPIFRFEVANSFDSPCICWIQFNWRITTATPQTLDSTYRKLLQIAGWKMSARTCLRRHKEASKSAHTG